MTDRYAVIGNPISHSKSPLIHSLFAKQTCPEQGRRTGQDMCYEAIESPLDGFAATIKRLRSEGYKGCNVTVPFKFEAFQLANELTERANAAQAVNTLIFENGKVIGDNTDGAGLVRDIELNLGVTLQGKKVLLMGAGGAAYGVALPLLSTGANIHIINRTSSKAQALQQALLIFREYPEESRCGVPFFIRDNTELSGLQFDVIINATSAGLTDSAVPLPEGIFASGALAYDMMYGRETPFMEFSRQQGATVADGLGMLVEQAAEAFYIWRSVRPDTATVIATLRNPTQS